MGCPRHSTEIPVKLRLNAAPDFGFGHNETAHSRFIPTIGNGQLWATGDSGVIATIADGRYVVEHSGVGIGFEVGVTGQAKTLFEIGVIDGAEGTAAGNGLAFTLPSGSVIQVGGGLLQCVEHEASILVLDAALGEGPEDFCERDLHGVHVLGEGEVERGIVTATAGASGLEAASTQVEVKITVVATFHCGGTAEDAIFLEMVTGRNRHKTSKKSN
jgi:hypothetical protein